MILPQYQEIALPPVRRGEVLRYAKTKSEVGIPLEACLTEANLTKGFVSFAECAVERGDGGLSFAFGTATSKDLKKALKGADSVLAFAATLGPLPDRLIAKYSQISPVKALLMQAVATERIEALCDAFCQMAGEEYEKRGIRLLPRFSPGYGDLSLDLQRGLLKAVDARRLLGISLTENLLMMPSKSVTAIAGLYREKGEIL